MELRRQGVVKMFVYLLAMQKIRAYSKVIAVFVVANSGMKVYVCHVCM